MPTLRLIKRNNGYYYAQVRGGRPFSLKTRNKEEAEKAIRDGGLEELAVAKRIGAHTPQFQQRVVHGRKLTLRQAVDQFMDYMPSAGYATLTIHHMRTHLERWLAKTELGAEPLTSIEAKQVDRWINSTKHTGSYKTRVRYLNDIRSLFNWAHSAGLIDHNPAQNVAVRAELLPQEKRVPKERLPLTDDEVAKILAETKPGEFWHAATLLAYETGLRLCDCCMLELSSLRGNALVIATGKNTTLNTIVTHRISDKCVDSLHKSQGWAERNRAGARYFFPEIAFNIEEDERRNTTYSQQFRRLCMKVGIYGKSFHGLRHTFSVRKKREERRKIFSEMLEELSLRNTATALGHKSIETTKTYTNHPAR